MVRDVKTNPYSILKTFVSKNKININLKLGNDFLEIKSTDLVQLYRHTTANPIYSLGNDDNEASKSITANNMNKTEKEKQ